ncbi:hypothetical protein [Bacillus sp. RC51]|uniref:hypothetical protein n=1 Tax=Bacillus TaxID=1386 RepID=UPI003836083F
MGYQEDDFIDDKDKPAKRFGISFYIIAIATTFWTEMFWYNYRYYICSLYMYRYRSCFDTKTNN